MHNVTNTQTLVDATNAKKSDLRRARAGCINLAPTTTGSATAIALIFPELKGKLNGHAVRVPLIAGGSLTDCVFEVGCDVTEVQVNDALKAASESGPLQVSEKVHHRCTVHRRACVSFALLFCTPKKARPMRASSRALC